MQILTNSRLSSFRSCRRLHWYRYHENRRPIRNAEELAFGTIMHSGLEAWWGSFIEHPFGDTLDEPTVAEIAIRAIRREYYRAAAERGDLDEFSLARAEVMMASYHARWFSAMEDYDVLGVETSFEMPLINPDSGRASRGYVLGGKVDAYARRRSDGTLWIIEHKTTTRDIDPLGSYWQRLRMDPQVSMYHLGLSSLFAGEAVAGCLYDVLRKPRHAPKKAVAEVRMTQGKPCKACASPDYDVEVACEACGGSGWKEAPRPYAGQQLEDETVDEYRERLTLEVIADPNAFFVRQEIVRLDEDIVEFRRDVWQTAQALHIAVNAKTRTRNPDRCFDFERPCDYWGVCSGTQGIDDDSIFRNSDQHEELISAAQLTKGPR